MIKILVHLFAFAVCSVAGDPRISHLQLDGIHLLITNPSNYAISKPRGNDFWRTVSVNQNTVHFTPHSGCQPIVKQLSSLSEAERTSIEGIRHHVDDYTNGRLETSSHTKFSSALFDESGSKIDFQDVNHSSSAVQINQLSVETSGDGDFSISKPDLPSNLARFFLDDGVVTYVYRDGQLLMNPVECLNANENLLLEQLKTEARQVSEQSMHNLHQSMHNLHQDMHNMRRNIFHKMRDIRRRMSRNFEHANFDHSHFSSHAFSNHFHQPYSPYPMDEAYAPADDPYYSAHSPYFGYMQPPSSYQFQQGDSFPARNHYS